MLKSQAIGIHSADYVFIALEQFRPELLPINKTNIRLQNYIFEKKKKKLIGCIHILCTTSEGQSIYSNSQSVSHSAKHSKAVFNLIHTILSPRVFSMVESWSPKIYEKDNWIHPPNSTW